ncbi:unnamed protein product [Lactuca saligna]|uniref:Uncharacterized protein n=1 Tax=Lactuca saligna TaxID=75948 RepID=A0AA35YWE7_LACSI|nr:unnamed protein product [Lactuca saligna]
MMASSYSFTSTLDRSSKKSTINNTKACDCGSHTRIVASTTSKNPRRHFMGKCKYWKWLDVEPAQIPVTNVVEGMKVDLVALKTELEKVKEGMEQINKAKYSDANAMKDKLYKFFIGFLFLIVMYMMK